MVQIEGSVASAIDDEDDLDGGPLKQVSAYRVEWHQDKEGLGCFFTPKGSRGFSPGFQPREHRPTAARPEGALDQTSPQRKSNVYASLALSGRTICLDGSQG
jgi:hypothetical protein